MVLTVLHPKSVGDARDEGDLSVDVVAVHGLNGGPTKTWTHPKTKSFWLQDFLPMDIPGVRVLNFSYNADAAFGNTTADILDHAKDLLGSLIDKRAAPNEQNRPIMFIAHSLGGIVVKQALVWAHVDSQYQSIKDHTIGIAFLGTPHRGSSKASYGKVLANVATTLTRQPTSRLMNTLRSNSDPLMRLTSEFKFQALNFHILSFYETKPMTVFSSLIVEKHSAMLETVGEDQQPVNANHREICKFTSRDDETYQKLVNRLNRTIKEKKPNCHSASQAPNQAQSRVNYNKYYEVPHNVSSIYTGRDEIGKNLGDLLPSEPPTSQKIQKRHVLYGLGGSGKTQICLKFAQDHRESFYGVFFVDASSASRAEQDFSILAERCKVGPNMDDFKRWLVNSVEDWLLIIDNADDPSLDVSQFFPAGNRGSIIITTRNPDCKTHATVGSSEIGQLHQEEAVSLLIKASDVADDTLRPQAQAVAQILGYLALAITHAGAMIRQKLYSFEEYCAAYTRRRKDLLSVRPVQASAGYQYTVYTTWNISVASIREMAQVPTGPSKESQINASNALDLLNLFGFCHFDGIPEDLFEAAWRHLPVREAKFPWWASHVIPMLRENRSSEWGSSLFREATSLLATYSLISVTSNGISLHPLVHSWIRDSMSEEMQLQWWTTSVSTLAMAIASGDQYFHNRRLVTHMQSCLSTRSLADLLVEDEQSQERVEVVYWMVVAYGSSHVNKDGMLLGTQALKYSQKMLGDDHESTWYLLSDIACMYNNMDQCQETLNLLEARVTAVLESAASRIEGVIWCVYRIIRALRSLEHFQEAIKLAQKALDVRKEFLADDDDLIYVGKGQLATVYQDVGRIEEAVELSESVVEHGRRTLGEDDPGKMSSMNDLGLVYTEAGRYQEAVDLLQQVLEYDERSYGDEHLNTLFARENLAWAYYRWGKPEAGIPLLVEAIELGGKTGISHRYLQVWKDDLEKCQSHDSELRSRAYQQHIEAAEASAPEQCDPDARTGLRKWLRRRH